MLLSEGQMSDYKGAVLMFEAIPNAKEMIADKGYDGDWFRQALAARGTTACIPSKTNRKSQSRTIPSSIDSATISKTCSENSRTGVASTPAMTAAPTPSSQPSPSPQPSSSGSVNNES
jgi:IS5 family transposase